MKIIFLGTPNYVEPILDELKKNFEVVSAIRKPDDLDIDTLKDLKPDFFVVAAFGKILSKEILSIPGLGTINVHPSLLPKYRGPSPVQWTILNGDSETGLSLILMDEQVDHGKILFQEKVELNGNETFESLVEKLFKLASQNIVKVINDYSNGNLKPIEQNDNDASFTKLLSRDSGMIDINNPPANLSNMIRAYYPWPGVWFKWNEKTVKLIPENKIQVEGKKVMSFKDFINGYPEGKQILEKLKLGN